MTELEKAAREELACSYMKLDKSAFAYDGCAMLNMFYKGAEWQAKQSPWIDVKKQVPNEFGDVLALIYYGGTLQIHKTMYNLNIDGKWCFGSDDEVIAWMPIPSFGNILEANKDVLQRIKEKGD